MWEACSAYACVCMCLHVCAHTCMHVQHQQLWDGAVGVNGAADPVVLLGLSCAQPPAAATPVLGLTACFATSSLPPGGNLENWWQNICPATRTMDAPAFVALQPFNSSS